MPKAFATLKSWGHDKPPLVRLSVSVAAASAGVLHEMMRTAATQPHLVFARERPGEWLALYRNSKSLLDRLAGEFLKEEAGAALEVWKNVQSGRVELNAHGALHETALAFVEAIGSSVLKETLPSVSPASIDHEKLRQEMESAFYGMVVLPCVLRFDTLPSFLYARARRGDKDALYKLLVLDLGVLECERIRRWVYEIRKTGSAGERRKLACALEGKGYRYPSRKALKARFAAFLDRAFRDTDEGALKLMAKFPQIHIPQHRVLAPEFRAAFDAAAKDMLGHEIDTDLPDGETLYKLIQRADGFSALLGNSRTKRGGKMSG